MKFIFKRGLKWKIKYQCVKYWLLEESWFDCLAMWPCNGSLTPLSLSLPICKEGMIISSPASQIYCGDQMGHCKWNFLGTVKHYTYIKIHQEEMTFTLELISKNMAFVSISEILISYTKVLKIIRGGNGNCLNYRHLIRTVKHVIFVSGETSRISDKFVLLFWPFEVLFLLCFPKAFNIDCF